jgi:Domain of unknown function (DUF4126)
MTSLISTVLGISFAAGLNTYATVLALGVMHRFGIIHLPHGLDVVSTTPIMIVAASLYGIEFLADKIPWIDSFWDGIHTVIRPAAGALLAYGVVGNVDPQWQVIATLVGGSVALASHSAKASTRAVVNVSPEPVSNWVLSLAEDGTSFVLVWLTASHPLVALAVTLLLVFTAIVMIWKLSKFVRRVFRRAAQSTT